MAILCVPYRTLSQMSRVTLDKSREYQARHKAKDPIAYAAKKAALNRNWIERNRERYNRAKSEYRFKLKIEAIDHYSNGTMCCGICGFGADIDALCLDHIQDNGATHRKDLGCGGRGLSGGTTIYERLKALGWLPGLQVLCANCNTIKAVRLRRGNTAADMLSVVHSGPTRWRK